MPYSLNKVRALPTIDNQSVMWLEHHLKNEYELFEYGCGASTIFFSQRVKNVISIEHDEIWVNKIRGSLDEQSIDNVEMKFIPPESSLDVKDTGDLNAYASTDYKKSFKTYVKSIDSYPDDFFDFIVVDGRSRACCLKHSQNKIKIGGHIILDDWQRRYYSEGLKLFKGEMWKKESIGQALAIKRIS